MNKNSNQLALTLELDTERRQDLPPADRALIERAIRCLEERYRVNLDVLTSPAATRDYVKLRLDGLGYEVFAMILLDNRHGVMRYVELFRGDPGWGQRPSSRGGTAGHGA